MSKAEQKEMIVSTFVFGAYSIYIAPYIFFLKRAYPDYYPLIFYHGSLSKEERAALHLLEKKFDFTVIENYFSQHSFTQEQRQHAEAIRWMLWDEKFETAKGVYIGDIDLFIFSEQEDMLSAHIRHCCKLKLPYSNAVRTPTPFTPKITHRTFSNTVHSRGLNYALSLQKQNVLEAKRLTGLHFFIPSEYKNNYLQIRDKYLNIISDKNEFIWHRNGFGDEELLYDMMEECGWINDRVYNAQLKKQESSENEYFYRPHHGIHIGIFRNKKTIENNYSLFQTCEFVQHFKQFIQLETTDVLYKTLYHFFPEKLRQEISTLKKVVEPIYNKSKGKEYREG